MSPPLIFYGQAFRHAWIETKSFFGWNRRKLIAALVLIGSWLILWWWRDIQAVENAIVAGLALFVFICAAGVVVFSWNLLKAFPDLARNLENERDQAKAALSELLLPKLDLVYRTEDQRYCHREEDGAKVYQLSLHNRTIRTIDNIEIYCEDILPIAGAHSISVDLRTATSSPPLRLSNGEQIFRELLSVGGDPTAERVAVLLPYRGPRSETVTGGHFVMKVVAIGRDIPAIRKKIRFGRQAGAFFLTAEDKAQARERRQP